MVKSEQNVSSIITTFSGDIYIIKDKTPDQIQDLIDVGGDMVSMPNGSRVNKKSISTIQSYSDYTFQVDQKARHRKGQYLKSGEWHDNQGSLGISSHLEKITGDLSDGFKKLKASDPTPVKQLARVTKK